MVNGHENRPAQRDTAQDREPWPHADGQRDDKGTERQHRNKPSPMSHIGFPPSGKKSRGPFIRPSILQPESELNRSWRCGQAFGTFRPAPSQKPMQNRTFVTQDIGSGAASLSSSRSVFGFDGLCTRTAAVELECVGPDGG